MDWLSLAPRLQNSVVQLRVTSGKYNPKRPYQSPSDSSSLGSGFFLDGPNGIILTNAHVVENALNITARLPAFGREDFDIKILTFIPSKDLATCCFSEKSLNKIKEVLVLEDLTMPLADSVNVQIGEPALAVGYPLGMESIKFTEGIVSGFQMEEENNFQDPGFREDSYRRPPTYIQTSAPINSGNSGGPLINTQGEVIGVIAAGIFLAQNVGFSIISRLVSAFYSELTNPDYEEENPVVWTPTLAMEYSPSQELQDDDSCVEGVYIRKLGEDSVLAVPTSSYLSFLEFEEVLGRGERTGVRIRAELDRYSNCWLYRDQDGDLEKVTDRRLSLSEVVDLIPAGTEFRAGNSSESYDQTWSVVPSDRILKIFPRWDPSTYILWGGMCLTQLTLNQVKEFPQLNRWIPYGKALYKPWIVISYVFPGTLTAETKIFQSGDLLVKVNETPVTQIDQLPELLEAEQLWLETKSGARLMLTQEQVDEMQPQVQVYL